MLGIFMGQGWGEGRLWSPEKTSSQASDLFWNLPALCVSLPFTRRQTIGYKIWESNLWSLLEQKGCVGDGGGAETGWAAAAEALPVCFWKGSS